MYAIIGLGVRLPGGTNTPQQFYENLLHKKDCVEDIHEDRWNKDFFQSRVSARPGKMVTKRCGLIRPFYEFDNEAFSLSKKEAMSLDPSAKVLLEVALETFEDANVRYKSTNTGVFVGSGQMGFVKYATQVPEYCTEYSATGCSLAIHSNMISYKLDLRGPSFTCESACSSSGSAFYSAINSLEAGDIDMALVGGYNNLLNYAMTIAFSRLGVLAPDGKCKSFDASANGYVRSEGCGMVLLKPLKKAVSDGNHIYAVVRGCSANEDGALEPSLTKPSKVAHENLMRRAYEKAGIDPTETFYFEAHATGTLVGDPTETNAIGKVCRGPKSKSPPLLLGSVKTNIGHTELASFISSLIKCCIMIDKKTLLPTIHQTRINPKLKMKKFAMKVQTEVEKFEPHGKVFGINSFGFGGSNTCVVIQGYCPEPSTSKSSRDGPGRLRDGPSFLSSPYPYIISARTKSALAARIQQYQDFSNSKSGEEVKPLGLSYTLATAQREGDLFLSYGIGNKAQDTSFTPPIPITIKGEGGIGPGQGGMARAPLCFVFSGQGPQNGEMGRELYRNFPVFRSFVNRCNEVYLRETGIDVVNGVGLFGEKRGGGERIHEIMITLPALMFMQLGLWELVKSFGVKPDVIVGHSFGEMCAMYANGAVTLDQIISVTATRGKLVKTVEHMGQMIAVGTSVDEINKIISENGIEKLWISADNSPLSCTVGGIPESVKKLNAICEKRKIFHRILAITNAYHTPLLDCLREKAEEAFGKNAKGLGVPVTEFVSTVTGGFWEEGKTFSGSYFFENILNTVQFRGGMQAVLRKYGEETIFVEIAPHPVLGLSMKQCGAKNVVGTVWKGQGEQGTVLGALGKLVGWGVEVDWEQVYLNRVKKGKKRGKKKKVRKRRVMERLKYLPPYPFQRRNCFLKIDTMEWRRFVPEYQREEDGTLFLGKLIGRKYDGTEEIWKNLVNTHKFRWCKDHNVHGAVVFPGAGYVDTVLELLKYQADGKKGSSNKKFSYYLVNEIDILSPFTIPTEQLKFKTMETKLMGMNSSSPKIEISSRNQDSIGQWTTHMTCEPYLKELNEFDQMRIESEKEAILKKFRDGDVYKDIMSCDKKLKEMVKREIYDRFEVLMHLQYGPCFQCISRILQGDEEVVAFLSLEHLDELIENIESNYVIHPAILDNVFQTLLCTYREMKTYLPTHVGSFEFYVKKVNPKVYSNIVVYSYLTTKNDRKITGNILVFDEKCENLLLKVSDFEFTSTSGATSSSQRGEESRKKHVTTIWQSKRLGTFDDLFLSFQKGTFCEIEKEKGKKFADLSERVLPLLERYVLTKIQSSLKYLKGSTIPKRYHKYLNWLLEANDNFVNRGFKKILMEEEAIIHKYKKQLGFETEMNLLDNVVKYLRLILRGKSGKFSEETKRFQWIGMLMREKSFTFGSTLKILKTMFETILSGCGEGRVIRIVELSSNPKYMTFMETLCKIFEPCNGKIEVIVVSPSIIHSDQQKKKLEEEEKEALLSDCTFIQYIDDLDEIEEKLPNCIDIVLSIDPQNIILKENRELYDTVCRLLTPDGLLVEVDIQCNEIFEFWQDFVFGAITDDWQKKSKGETKPLSENFTLIGKKMKVNNSCVSIYRRDSEEKAKKKKKKDVVEGDDENIEVFYSPDVFQLLEFVKAEIVRYRKMKEEERREKRLLVITQGVYDTENPSLEYSKIVGFVRTLTNEMYGSRSEKKLFGGNLTKIVDFPTSFSAKEIKEKWVDKLKVMFLNNTLESENCVRYDQDKKSHEVFVSRLVSIPTKMNGKKKKIASEGEGDEKKKKKLSPSSELCYRLQIEQPGMLNSLEFRPVQGFLNQDEVEDEDVIVKVSCSTLNFKDVMLAMNLLKKLDEKEEEGEDEEIKLGLEFSGVIVQKGKKVTKFEIGDEVFGFGDSSLSTHVKTSQHLITAKPKNLTHAEAASIPTIFTTSYVALIEKAQIEEDDKILIHSAAGGVGQSALQLVNSVKGIAIATCGSEKKREFLRKNYGVKIFGNSHSNSWEREVSDQLSKLEKMKKMKKRCGVDVVLNSLAGDHIERGIKLLSPFGSFIEIGKRDILDNNPLFLRPFLENLSFFSVHIDKIIKQKPKRIGRILQKLSKMLEEKKIRPVVIDKVFPGAKIIDGFRYMQSGKHLGKIIIDFTSPIRSQGKEEKEEEMMNKKLFSSNKTYIISGGLGVIGFILTKYLVQNGAKYVICLSRSGRMTKSQLRTIEKFQRLKKHILISKTDVSKRSEVKDLYQKVISSHSFPEEIGGIFHLAMVLRDGRIEVQTKARFEESFAPKISGAMYLVEECLKWKKSAKPDFVVFFSSISSTVGNLEQSNYASGNSFLDSYAYYLRQKEKISTKVINLGAVVDVGVIAENLNLRKIMEQGVLWGSAMTISQVLESIKTMVTSPIGQVQFVPEVKFDRLIEHFPFLAPRFSHLLIHKSSGKENRVGTMMNAAISAQSIRKLVGGLLLVEPKSVPIDEPLTRYGVDSLLAVEISSILKKRFEMSISQMDILGGMSISQIVDEQKT